MNKLVRNVLRVIFVLIILASAGFFVYDYLEGQKVPEIFQETASEIEVSETEKKDYNLEQGTKLKLSPDVDLAAKRREYKNNDIIGRLEVPGLFNVLVVKGKDNDYYLGRDTRKKLDARGTEYMDFRNSINSKQINIYGHSSRDERIQVPFKKLSKFADQKYFEQNPYIVFQTDEGRSYYKIMNIKGFLKGYNQHMDVNKTGDEFISHVSNMLSNSVNIREMPFDKDSEILTLQTCAYFANNAYYLIVAKKI